MIRVVFRVMLLVALLSGCVAYNDDCPGDDTEIVGYTETLLELRKSVVRTSEAPVGNLIADAFFASQRERGADLALINAGTIRGEATSCGQSYLDRGPLSARDIESLLPFENTVQLVQVTGSQLRRTLEHAVAQLGNSGPIGASGRFVQVSHVHFAVDCDAPAQEGTQVGQRISDLTILRDDGSSFVIDTQDEIDANYLVATNSFLAQGGDGFVWLTTGIPGAEAPRDAEVLENFIATAPEQTVRPGIENRIDIATSCLPR